MKLFFADFLAGLIKVSKVIVPTFVLSYVIEYLWQKQILNLPAYYYEGYWSLFILLLILVLCRYGFRYYRERKWWSLCGVVIGGISLIAVMMLGAIAIACLVGTCL